LCETPILIHIGTFSYGMYVFHQMFRMIFEWYLRRPLMATGLPVWLVQIIYVVACIFISYLLARLSWKYIEERFIKMK
jgi:peptidoglycan/LPS O-acetylase OafA/YrhL